MPSKSHQHRGSPDFVYENPPLVEVIAEIKWALQRADNVGDFQIDPHYENFAAAFRKKSAEDGFSFTEQLIPDVVPRQMLPHRVLTRFRRGEGLWPVLQIGPGIVTANIVPPYNGWRSFLPVISNLFERLQRSYPMPKSYLNISGLELRYIDAFTSAHGMNELGAFIREDMGFSSDLRDRLRPFAAPDSSEILQIGELQLNLNRPSESTGVVRIDTGRVVNTSAVLTQFIVRTSSSSHIKSKKGVERWFNDAHEVVRKWFDLVSSDRVKAKFGEKRTLSE